MKRFIISLIILFVIIISSFSIPCYLKKTTEQLTYQINEIKQDIQSKKINSALEKTEFFIKYWEDKKDIITIFVNHDEMDFVTYTSAKLPSLLIYNNISEFCAELNHVESIVNAIYSDDVPNFKNII